jgi:hypothetical protein
MCPVCKEDYILLLQAHRELWGDDFNPVEVQQFNWGEFLKDKVSSVEMGIRSFVLQVIKSTQPEPAENIRFMMVRPQATWVETKQFFSGANMSLEIEIPKDGHVTVFTLSESGDIRLVFPLFPQVNTSVSGETITRISFEAPASLGPWTVKAILTTDDPLGSRDLPFDESWNNRVLECLAKHIKGLDKDGWAAGTLEFEVR